MMRESDRQHRKLAESSARQVRRLSREITPPAETTLAATSTGARWAFEERREVRSKLPTTRTPTALRPFVVILIASSSLAVSMPSLATRTAQPKDVGVYVTGEGIRGLADLEAK
jgi:hypothetical protein